MNELKPWLVSKLEFAKVARVSPPAVTYLSRGKLSGAMVGRAIDLNHPDVQEYLKSRAGVPTRQKPKRIEKVEEEPVEEEQVEEEQVEEEPVEEAPPPTQVRRAATPREQAQTAAMHLRLAEQTGLLVSRGLVDQVFRDIQEVFSDLLKTRSAVLALAVCRELQKMESIPAVELVVKKCFTEMLNDLVTKVADDVKNF